MNYKLDPMNHIHDYFGFGKNFPFLQIYRSEISDPNSE